MVFQLTRLWGLRFLKGRRSKTTCVMTRAARCVRNAMHDECTESMDAKPLEANHRHARPPVR